MADEDARDVQRGIHFPHRVSAAIFVRMGLEVEDHQYVTEVLLFWIAANTDYRRRLLVKYAKRGTRPPAEKASLQEQRNALKKEIDKWREIQRVYMPGVAALQGTDNDPDSHLTEQDERPEASKLCLPSAIPISHRENACVRGVVEKETRLRMAQLQDALVELCRARRVRKGASLFFDIHISGTGQRPATRHQTKIHTIDHRITRAVKRYRDARVAMLSLNPSGDWKKEFLELKDTDNRGPGRELEEESEGEGAYEVSWIWLAPGATSRTAAGDEPISIEEVNEGMRVEWARTLARADRWAEEVKLLVAEMERTLKFLEWKARWWLTQKGLRRAALEITHGLNAYANSQAAVYNTLASSFARRWVPLLNTHHIDCTWAHHLMPSTATTTSDDTSTTTGQPSGSPLPGTSSPLNPLSPPFFPSGLGMVLRNNEVESDGNSDSGDSSGSDNEDNEGSTHPPPASDDDELDLDCS